MRFVCFWFEYQLCFIVCLHATYSLVHAGVWVPALSTLPAQARRRICAIRIGDTPRLDLLWRVVLNEVYLTKKQTKKAAEQINQLT